MGKPTKKDQVDDLKRQTIIAQWMSETREQSTGEGIALRASTPLAVASAVVRAFRDGPDEYSGGFFRIVRSIEPGKRDTVLFVERTTGIWSESVSVASRYIQAVVRSILEHAAHTWTAGELKSLAIRLPVMEGPSFETQVMAMLPTAARTAGIGIIEWTAFNRSRNHIGTPSGVLDLDRMKLLAPVYGKDHLVTLRTRVRFDPKAEHPVVDALTAHLDDAVRDFLWEGIGYALLGRAGRRFYVFIGETGTGKTYLADCLKLVLGDYASTIPRGAMAMPRRAADAISSAGLAATGRVFVGGVRLAIEDEPNPQTFDAPRLKNITGGGIMDWKPLNGQWRSGLLTATPIFFTNDLASVPKLGLSDEALVDRLAIVRFPNIPDEQKAKFPNLEAVKDDPKFRSALFARLVRAAADASLRCEEDSDHPPALIPEVASQIREARERESGDIGLLAARIVEDEGGFLPFQSVWQEWARLCDHDFASGGKEKVGDISRRSFRRAIERWSPQLARGKYSRRRMAESSNPVSGWAGFSLLPMGADGAPVEKEASAQALPPKPPAQGESSAKSNDGPPPF